MSQSLIRKQIELLTTAEAFANIARVCDSEEILIYSKSSSGTITPVANEEVQSQVLTEAVANEIRSSALDSIDNVVLQLDALGLSLSSEAVAEITTTQDKSE